MQHGNELFVDQILLPANVLQARHAFGRLNQVPPIARMGFWSLWREHIRLRLWFWLLCPSGTQALSFKGPLIKEPSQRRSDFRFGDGKIHMKSIVHCPWSFGKNWKRCGQKWKTTPNPNICMTLSFKSLCSYYSVGYRLGRDATSRGKSWGRSAAATK